MNNKEQRKILSSIKQFIVDYFDETMVEDMQFLTGAEGKVYCEYADDKTPYVSFDGGIYDYINYGIDNWKFQDAFTKFLNKQGFWYEQGNTWNMNIYRK